MGFLIAEITIGFISSFFETDLSVIFFKAGVLSFYWRIIGFFASLTWGLTNIFNGFI